MLKNHINGEWIPSFGKESVDVFNPATMKVLDQCPLGSPEDVSLAVAAATEAFKTWRKVPTLERTQYLFKMKQAMEDNFDELVQLCTAEHGKTLVESRGDVRRGIQMVETACGMPSLMMGDFSEDIAAGIDSQAGKGP